MSGLVPIFLSSQTQSIVDCVADKDVTAASPLKLIKKETILNDIKTRAGVSDFKPFNDVIQNYSGDDILLVFDSDFESGQNFLLATTEEAKTAQLKKHSSTVESDMSLRRQSLADKPIPEEDELASHLTYKPPVPKPWETLGSEKEIHPRPRDPPGKAKLRISVTRKRRQFELPINFGDRSAGDAKDAYTECLPYEDRSFELRRSEVDRATQAVSNVAESSAQTEYRHPRHACTQYFPRELEEKDREREAESTELAKAIKNLVPRFEAALQQNEILDVFHEDWLRLADDDGTFGSKSNNNLKEYQSFTDLVFSKDKVITCIDWHPTIKGVVAVAAAEKLSFADRIDSYSRLIMNPSLILVWSFTDPIHPQLLLEAPDDIFCFQFNPSDPNIVAGGCMNGQVVVWDIGPYADRLKSSKTSKSGGSQGGGGSSGGASGSGGGFEADAAELECPMIRYAAVSAIEQSHKSCITDLLWLPDHFEVSRLGVPLENKNLLCSQILTCASDQVVLFWDIRPPVEKAKGGGGGGSMERGGTTVGGTITTSSTSITTSSGGGHTGSSAPDASTGDSNPEGSPVVVNKFKHLDLTWKPLLKVTLPCSDPGGDFAPTKFSIQETQGDRSSLEGAKHHEGEDDELGDSSYVSGRVSASNKQRMLTKVSTKFYLGTEDGHLVYVDWKPVKDNDTGKISTPRATFWNAIQDGPVVTLLRSPFFKDIILCVGGWTFTIWKEGVHTGPLLQSSADSKRLTCAHWSPTRPGVFYIAKSDGNVDIWDLLDRTHEPSLTQNVSAASITSIYPKQVSSKKHLLAIGDGLGTLHILEIPWSLRQPAPNESVGVANYLEREVKRCAFGKSRWEMRAREKRDLEKREAQAQAAMKTAAPPATEDELIEKMQAEYKAYLELEKAVLMEMGLWLEIDEDIPS